MTRNHLLRIIVGLWLAAGAVFTLAATGNTFALFSDHQAAAGDVNAGVFETDTPTPTATFTDTATPPVAPSATPTPVGPPCAPVRDANLSFHREEVELEGDGPFDATFTLRNTGSHATAIGVVIGLYAEHGAKYIDRVALPGGGDWYVSGGASSTSLAIGDIAPGSSVTLTFGVYMRSKWLTSDDAGATIKVSIESAACTRRGGAHASAAIELERDDDHHDGDDHHGDGDHDDDGHGDDGHEDDGHGDDGHGDDGHGDDGHGHEGDGDRLAGEAPADAAATGTPTATPSATPTPAGAIGDEPTVTATPVPPEGAAGP